MHKPKIKTLPSIRIDSETESLIQSSLRKLNENSLVEITTQDLRRICYEFCCRKILSGEQIKVTH